MPLDPAPPIRCAYVFPGQGAQAPGMGRAVLARFPQAVAEASDLLGYRVDRLCLDDPERRLGRTEFTQPAMFLVCALEYRAFLEDGAPPPARRPATPSASTPRCTPRARSGWWTASAWWRSAAG